MDERDKLRRLLSLLGDLLDREENPKIIIFAATKRSCDDIVYELRRSNVNSLGIHGDKQQQERDWVLNQFRSSQCSILVATDVASRGLDVSDIKYVINFDMPGQLEDYIHR